MVWWDVNKLKSGPSHNQRQGDCPKKVSRGRAQKKTRGPLSRRWKTIWSTEATNLRVLWAKSVKSTTETTLQQVKMQTYRMKKKTQTRIAAICTSHSVATAQSQRAARWRKDTNTMQTRNPGREGKPWTLWALMQPHRSRLQAAHFLRAQWSLKTSWQVLWRAWTYIHIANSKSRIPCWRVMIYLFLKVCAGWKWLKEYHWVYEASRCMCHVKR